jgi:putative ABC transport system permease protein
MLIIVKERTKEIGIRKALGATPKSIISMILTEAVFITTISGYLGIVFATGLIWLISSVMFNSGVETQNFHNPQVNLYIGVLALFILIISGALAGFIPALQASKVNPVDALKDE